MPPAASQPPADLDRLVPFVPDAGCADAFRIAQPTTGKALPDEILVLPWGTSQTNKGHVTVNGHTITHFATTQQTNRGDSVARDLAHQCYFTLGGNPNKHIKDLTLAPKHPGHDLRATPKPLASQDP